MHQSHSNWRKRAEAEAPDLIEELLSQFIRAVGLHQPIEIGAGRVISPSEALALAELAGGLPLSQQELAEQLRLEKSSVSRLVVGLERSGWLVRERDPANQRAYQIRVTPSGRRVVRAWRRHWRDRHRRILASLTGGEQDAVRAGFAALARAISAAHRPG